MNWNVIRTAMATIGTALIGIVDFLPGFIGCTKVIEKYDCTASWLPIDPGWLTTIGWGLWVATLFAKAFTQGGTVAENLGSKAVIVTPVDKQGTVTPSQVASGTKA